MSKGWEAVNLSDLDAIPVTEGLVWHPVRRRLGILAFGVNAYTSDAVGHQVVEEHDETGSGAGGHEELYVVIRGRATFTIDGETLDAPAGTLVFVRDPKVKRVAMTEEEGTLVLAVGGEPGRVYEVSPWEFNFAAMPLQREGRFAEAIELLEGGLRECPGNASILYNLACAESGAGRPLDALTHLQEAVRLRPDLRARARADTDFDAIRREPGFPG
jgi:mannose-6-phosphate isomerase-like protein (cupin superfamily)